MHQIAAGEQFIGRQHAVEGFAWNAHEARVAGADAYEHRVIAHFGNHLFDGEQASDQRVALESDAEFEQFADLGIDHAVGQAKFRNAVFQHATRLVEGLIDRDIAAGFRHVGSAGHAGGTRTDDADLQAVQFDVGNVGPAFGDGQIANKALKPADCHRFERIADNTDAFALGFLRTDPPAHGGQQIGIGDNVVGAAIIFFAYFLDEAGNIDADRTARDARRLQAQQATIRFVERLLERVAAIHLVKIAHPLCRLLFAYWGALLRNGPYGSLFRHEGSRSSRPAPVRTDRASRIRRARNPALSCGS